MTTSTLSTDFKVYNRTGLGDDVVAEFIEHIYNEDGNGFTFEGRFTGRTLRILIDRPTARVKLWWAGDEPELDSLYALGLN